MRIRSSASRTESRISRSSATRSAKWSSKLKSVKETTDPKSWTKAAKLAQQARLTLANPEAKAKLDARFGIIADEPPTPQASDPLAGVLPASDPLAGILPNTDPLPETDPLAGILPNTDPLPEADPLAGILPAADPISPNASTSDVTKAQAQPSEPQAVESNRNASWGIWNTD